MECSGLSRWGSRVGDDDEADEKQDGEKRQALIQAPQLVVEREALAGGDQGGQPSRV